jgi:hypothetical protein
MSAILYNRRAFIVFTVPFVTNMVQPVFILMCILYPGDSQFVETRIFDTA